MSLFRLEVQNQIKVHENGINTDILFESEVYFTKYNLQKSSLDTSVKIKY